MSYKRYNIQLAYKEPISSALQGKFTALEALLKDVKKKAVKINEGKPNEGNTVTAAKHICHHDEGKSCDPWEEI